MGVRRGFAVGAATALSTTYAAIALTGVAGTDPLSQAIPDECFLGLLTGAITTIAGGPASIVWYLAADAAGDVPITDAVTTTILTGLTTATKGGVSEVVG